MWRGRLSDHASFMNDMSNLIFLYGTLLPGKAPHVIAHAVEQLREIGKATVCGCLYNLGRYPGAILSDVPEQCIRGRVFELPDDPRMLQEMDQYEGFYYSTETKSLFVRESCVATLDDGRRVECWIYVYNRPVSESLRIASGEYTR